MAVSPEKIDGVQLHNVRTWDPVLKPLGYAQDTSVSGASALPSIPATARAALIQCTGANLRWRDDGTNPSATVGMLLLTTSDGLWYTGDLSAMKVIEVSASAVLNVAYYGSI